MSLLSLTQPITPNTLKLLRDALKTKSYSPINVERSSKSRSAAVLIPFCNVAGRPGILFELRGRNLRRHSGEVSFPGGRVDASDPSFSSAALRETHEELGILPDRVTILGEMGPPEVNLSGDLQVWPYVGFVHSLSKENAFDSGDDPLPSIDIDAIRKEVSQTEVAAVFHLPLAELAASWRADIKMFRGQRPYWTINVTDLVPEDGIQREVCEVDNTIEQKDEVGAGRNGLVEIWGLTGWYLTLLIRILRMKL